MLTMLRLWLKKKRTQERRFSKLLLRNLIFLFVLITVLKRAGINTVEELVLKNEEEMMKVRNLGRKSLEEVQQKLQALGLGLRVND